MKKEKFPVHGIYMFSLQTRFGFARSMYNSLIRQYRKGTPCSLWADFSDLREACLSIVEMIDLIEERKKPKE